MACYWGWRPLGAVPHSSNEQGELSRWVCHDGSTNIVLIVIVVVVAVIIIIFFLFF